MSDRKIRLLERAWEESGSFADENALVAERRRLGLVDDGDLVFAQWITNDDGSRYPGPAPTVEASLRGACLFTYLLACRYARPHRETLRASWLDPKKSRREWVDTWHEVVGHTQWNRPYEWWPYFFGSYRVYAHEAYHEFVDHTTGTVTWNAGAAGSAKINRQRIRLLLRCLVPFLLGHGLPELPETTVVGRR